MERFLYRLSVSPFADQFTLKGALALLAWTGGRQMYRPTMDIDLLGRTSNDAESLVGAFRSVVEQDVTVDGQGSAVKLVGQEEISAREALGECADGVGEGDSLLVDLEFFECESHWREHIPVR